MENRTEKYVSTRQSKVGKIDKKKVAVVATIAVLGTVGICGILSKGKDDNYTYDPSFKSYSSQIEYLNDVDLDEDVESQLNELQDITVAIDQYQHSDDEQVKSEAWEKLSRVEEQVQQSTLDAVKEVTADNYGGNPNDMQTTLDKGDGTWMITHTGDGTRTLTGKSLDAVIAVSNSQDGKEIEILTTEEKDEYVDELSDMIKANVDLRVSEAPKSK